MNCAEVMEWMHRYLDHDLSRDESLEMFRHIDGCPSCAELFERLNALSSELEQLPDVSPPFSLVDSIMPKLEAIDRERAAAAAPSTAETDSLQMSRKASRAKARQSSSLAGRFGIGAAAAAVIFGIAIFNMPEKLPGAQVDNMMKSTAEYNDFKGNASSAANAGGADTGPEESSGGAGVTFGGSGENSAPA
ncbi:anti-sigma factor family protein, partial [Paenibacillus durus]